MDVVLLALNAHKLALCVVRGFLYGSRSAVDVYHKALSAESGLSVGVVELCARNGGSHCVLS